MGEALKALNWPRLNYVVSTKFFWGLDREGDAVNRKDTLNRKYLMQAIDGSLQRMQLDHIDLVYCHRPDPHTPIEETVCAMSDMITQGKALYWGTSEWSAADIRAAWDIAERHHLHKPVMEQPQYHLFHRQRVEQEYARAVRRHRPGPDHLEPAGLGPADRQVPRRRARRAAAARWRAWPSCVDGLTDPAKNAAVAQLEPIAAELGGSVAQLAIAWVARNPHVSTVITGASRLDAAAGQPRRAGAAGQADARGAGAHRRRSRAPLAQ